MYIETGYKKKNNINFLSYYNFHRLSLQPGLWKRSFFLKMLKKAIFNPRQFEEIGSILTKKKTRFMLYQNLYFIILNLLEWEN